MPHIQKSDVHQTPLTSSVRAENLKNTIDFAGSSYRLMTDTSSCRDLLCRTDTVMDLQATGEKLLTEDLKNLSLLILVDNDRKIGLNLKLYSSMEEFIHDLHEDINRSPFFHGRYILGPKKVLDGKAESVHHIFADISSKPNKPLSVILVESATLNAGTPTILEIIKQLKSSTEFHNAHVGVIASGVQKSARDCLMFSKNFASQALKHESLFLKWHEQQINRIKLGDPVTDQPSTQMIEFIILPSLKESQQDDCSFYEGAGLLPIDFAKYIQSSKKLKEYIEKHPDHKQDLLQSNPSTEIANIEKRYKTSLVQTIYCWDSNNETYTIKSISQNMYHKRIKKYKQALSFIENGIKISCTSSDQI